jgi:hypothetical protein
VLVEDVVLLGAAVDVLVVEVDEIVGTVVDVN